jgi:hypothetical protein
MFVSVISNPFGLPGNGLQQACTNGGGEETTEQDGPGIVRQKLALGSHGNPPVRNLIRIPECVVILSGASWLHYDAQSKDPEGAYTTLNFRSFQQLLRERFGWKGFAVLVS